MQKVIQACATGCALLSVAACSHYTLANARTTPLDRELMLDRANYEVANKPDGWRITKRHGPMACYERWRYRSADEFNICVTNWRDKEVRYMAGAGGGSFAAGVMTGVLVGLAAGQRHLACVDGTVSPSCVEGRPSNAGCCSDHLGVVYDANGYPVYR